MESSRVVNWENSVAIKSVFIREKAEFKYKKMP